MTNEFKDFIIYIILVNVILGIYTFWLSYLAYIKDNREAQCVAPICLAYYFLFLASGISVFLDK